MNISKAIKLARKQNNLNQAQLAEKVGVTQAYISQLESGRRDDPQFSLLQKVATALEIPLSILLLEALEEKEIKPGKEDLLEDLRGLMHKLLEG